MATLPQLIEDDIQCLDEILRRRRRPTHRCPPRDGPGGGAGKRLRPVCAERGRHRTALPEKITPATGPLTSFPDAERYEFLRRRHSPVMTVRLRAGRARMQDLAHANFFISRRKFAEFLRKTADADDPFWFKDFQNAGKMLVD